MMLKRLTLVAIMLFCLSVASLGYSQSVWSGTGFAIANGYVVTNYHVVDGAQSILVNVERNKVVKQYYADVVATDKINDIAVVKINDKGFKGFGSIPYGVTTRLADVGEDVFVMGYPLTQALGEEIKLTTGVVNSRTGGIGVENCYQIQAPITYGNSGGPMFDNRGNVIGIVIGGLDKELNLAENVGYAIKTAYLKIMIENAGLNIVFPSNNVIANLSRPEKVKRIRNFVFKIECSDKVMIKEDVTYNQGKGKDNKIGEERMVSDEYVDLGLKSGTLWKKESEKDYYTYKDAFNKFGKFLPTKKQWEELKNSCKWNWIGNGYNVTGPNGKTIFLPAADELEYIFGHYWSSTSKDDNRTWGLGFYDSFVYIWPLYVDCRNSVRLVRN